MQDGAAPRPAGDRSVQDELQFLGDALGVVARARSKDPDHDDPAAPAMTSDGVGLTSSGLNHGPQGGVSPPLRAVQHTLVEASERSPGGAMMRRHPV